MMKDTVIFLVFIFSSSLLNAQEKYFHELRGMEDSTGTTHLFYRLFDETYFQCAPEDHEDVIINTRNDVWHYNATNLSDSIKFIDFYEPWCLSGEFTAQGVNDYAFYENSPTKWVIMETGFGCFPFPITDFRKRSFVLPGVCLTKNKKARTYSDLSFLLSNDEDSLYYNDFANENHGLRVEINETSYFPSFESITNEEEYGFYITYINSVDFEQQLVEIHPTIDSLFYALETNGSLFVSDTYTSAFEIADSTSNYLNLVFDEDSTTIYARVQNGIKRSSNFGFAGSWESLSIPDELSTIQFVDTDAKKSGNLFIATTTSIYESDNFGNSFNLVFDSENEITGIYKKPGSDVLYVLTSDELIEFNTETQETTILKVLPVSTQEELDNPSTIQLFQNYPNPFNPSTKIRYRIPEATYVRLAIYNQLGRKIQTLVDEVQIQGNHEVSFDAANFASGVYYFELSVPNEGFREVRKMLLIK